MPEVSKTPSLMCVAAAAYHWQCNTITQIIPRENPSADRDVVKLGCNHLIRDHQEGLVRSRNEDSCRRNLH